MGMGCIYIMIIRLIQKKRKALYMIQLSILPFSITNSKVPRKRKYIHPMFKLLIELLFKTILLDYMSHSKNVVRSLSYNI